MRFAAPFIAVAALYAPPAVSPDVLEPSVRNEVDHAIDMAPTNLACAASGAVSTNGVALAAADIFGTNGLSRTEIAIKLVSEQKSDGRWLDGTNDVTSAAVEILKSL